jgi:hypothetical protein
MLVALQAPLTLLVNVTVPAATLFEVLDRVAENRARTTGAEASTAPATAPARQAQRMRRRSGVSGRGVAVNILVFFFSGGALKVRAGKGAGQRLLPSVRHVEDVEMPAVHGYPISST